ncbi:hypothetical protein L228DRAFT_243543 [Xylona heveae TC161]|uniref:C2H2-type domain-containing protein n=1 Tax=Xylona heveae (strain CBS 132557 / TC161) TaxID=1328760 RepID=A0A161TFK0_XYLHT|nr:hypothetical protein L228DRAFT_243543 [Xylona heveae TC161]KZF24817.1 hypothetical protein L228DRAFT_243543 [Xylona heveae TC161]
MDALRGDNFDVSVKRLVDGFDALYQEVQLLSLKRNQLEQKLSEARQTYLDFSDKYRWTLNDEDKASNHDFLREDEGPQPSTSNKLLNLQDLAWPGSISAEKAYNVIISAVEARDRIAVSRGWPSNSLLTSKWGHDIPDGHGNTFVKELDSGSGSPSLGTQPAPQMFSCRRCDNPFPSKKSLRKHIRAKGRCATPTGSSAKIPEAGTGQMSSIPKCPVSGISSATNPHVAKPGEAKALGEGRTQCPFASMQKQMMSSQASTSELQKPQLHSSPANDKDESVVDAKDPIAVEALQHEHISQPHSSAGSASRCPIRFLSQHSPEEVAQYFETHKHELPRSHEICVKRYQTNEQSIRELDAKYGNLVSMIQGLGMKHQPLLPRSPANELNADKSDSDVMVQKWAKTVASSLENDEPAKVDGPEAGEEQRESHFDRPMKEIRVGESPSRPWGIAVPAASSLSTGRSFQTHSSPAKSATSSKLKLHKRAPSDRKQPSSLCQDNVSADRPDSPDTPQTKKCDSKPRVSSRRPAKKGSRSMSKNMIFTGPVFFGYSEDQAIRILQQSK